MSGCQAGPKSEYASGSAAASKAATPTLVTHHVVGMSVTSVVLVVGRHHMRAERPNDLDQRGSRYGNVRAWQSNHRGVLIIALR